MDRTIVNSADISALCYDPITQILGVCSDHGTTHQYYNVNSFLYEELLAAPYKDDFFNARIRDNFQFS